MRRANNMIWGVILIIASIVLLLNSLGLTDISIFFSGWWTLFIIIPCFVGLLTGNDKTSNLIGLGIGVVLFLACRDAIAFDVLWKFTNPAIIALFGIKMIYKGVFGGKSTEIMRIHQANGVEHKSVFAAFSGQTVDYDHEVFRGAELTAVFGGVKCDLRNAVFEEDVVINTCSVFGGIDIFLPDDVNIKVDTNSLFGGVDTKKHENSCDNRYTVYLNSTCMFGGVDIK